MKEISTIIFPILLLTINCFSQNKTIVEGVVAGAAEEFVSLTYSPRLRGNLNFDDFKNIGCYLNKEGGFKMEAENIMESGNYSLDFPNQSISFNLFEGDSIHYEVSLANLDQAFATGKGAGKINLLNLAQYRSDYVDLAKRRNLYEFVDYVDSLIVYKLNLLEDIYFHRVKSELISQATNKVQILKVIRHSPLSLNEYEFLNQLIEFQFYNLLGYFLSTKRKEVPVDTARVDLNTIAFKHFREKDYRELDNLNDWTLANSLDVIIEIEYLRSKQQKDGIKVNYSNWKSWLYTPDYRIWISNFLNDNFITEISNKYYSDYALWFMTLGDKYEEILESIDFSVENKYTKRLKGYEKLLKTGLKINEYGLSESKRTLDTIKFQQLINDYKDSSVLMVFWSARYAGASIIGNLPGLKTFEDDYNGLVDVIYVCIDKKDHQNLWAARIIDESWNGKHYFLPIEGNDRTLDQFNVEDIDSFCSGGVKFVFINRNGEITNEIEAPYNLNRGELEDVYK